MDTLKNSLGFVGAICLAFSVDWIKEKVDKKSLNREERKDYREYKKSQRKWIKEGLLSSHNVLFKPTLFWIGVVLVSLSYALPLGCTLLNLS